MQYMMPGIGGFTYTSPDGLSPLGRCFDWPFIWDFWVISCSSCIPGEMTGVCTGEGNKTTGAYRQHILR